jgi:hypothetical protein
MLNLHKNGGCTTMLAESANQALVLTWFAFHVLSFHFCPFCSGVDNFSV